MPLTPGDAFKVGFLLKCAEDGLTPAETLARVSAARAAVEKRAFDPIDRLANGIGSAFGGVTDVAKGLASYAVPAALIAPPAIGALGGYALARATDVDDTDVGEIKNREVIDEYKRQSDKLRRQTAVRNYQQQRTQTGRMFR